MLAQQQNPHAVSYSLQQQQQQQQTESKEMNSEGEADVKTFSIRQYVLACRQKGLVQSWPFLEKYLKMCLDLGLRNVLPPFGLSSSNNNNSVSESSSHNNNGIIIPNLNDPCDDEDYDDDKNVGFLKSESPHHRHVLLEQMKEQNIVNLSDSGLLSNNEHRSKAIQEDGMISPADWVNHQIIVRCSSKSSGKLDRRRRKGRCKKRSMADILAEAKHCTLEEINRINQFSYAAAGNIIEGYCLETAPDLENDPKSPERYYDLEGADFDVNIM
ncbi:hypothetical protein QN277_027464 [Acacia crassicarpa]|uniref:Uncharacterized protein n=1 Tax=Acacia crassicarpa TaxID=499986 RepID=A0AAE1JD54_9FABA|nr:hypothetical protein QN277_027464 [Acacia crassicarpa]